MTRLYTDSTATIFTTTYKYPKTFIYLNNNLIEGYVGLNPIQPKIGFISWDVIEFTQFIYQPYIKKNKNPKSKWMRNHYILQLRYYPEPNITNVLIMIYEIY